MARKIVDEVDWDDRIANLDDKFLACYRRHSGRWDHRGDEVIEKSAANRPLVIRRTLRCSNCGTWRYDKINLIRWELVGRSYGWPDGYRMEGGDVDSHALLRERTLRENPELARMLGYTGYSANGKRK